MKTIRVFTLTPAICLLTLIMCASTWAPPAAAATDPERAFAADVAKYINMERAARGLSPVTWSFDETLRTHMAASRPSCITHSPQNEGLEAVTCVYPNAGQPGGAAAGAVYKWMKSTSHNGIFMYPASTWIKVGVFCDPSGIAYVAAVVEDDWTNPIPAFRGPISDYYLQGAQCTGPAPATTTPPPPATQPPPVTVPSASVAPGRYASPDAPPAGSAPVGREPAVDSPSTLAGSGSSDDVSAPSGQVDPATDVAGASAAGSGAAGVVPTSARLRDPDHSTYTSRPSTTVQDQPPPSTSPQADVASGSSSKNSTMAGWIVAAATVGVGSLVVVAVRLRRRHPAVPSP